MRYFHWALLCSLALLPAIATQAERMVVTSPYVLRDNGVGAEYTILLTSSYGEGKVKTKNGTTVPYRELFQVTHFDGNLPTTDFTVKNRNDQMLGEKFDWNVPDSYRIALPTLRYNCHAATLGRYDLRVTSIELFLSEEDFGRPSPVFTGSDFSVHFKGGTTGAAEHSSYQLQKTTESLPGCAMTFTSYWYYGKWGFGSTFRTPASSINEQYFTSKTRYYKR